MAEVIYEDGEVLVVAARGYRGLRVVSVRMPWGMVERLDMYARLLGVSRSELVRMAVERLLAELG